VVVLVNEEQFSVVRGINETIMGTYESMPFVSGGGKPNATDADGNMCVSDPEATGQRGYAAAVVLHKASNTKLCVLAGTFPHCRSPWKKEFVSNVKESCDGMPLLIIADSNAACGHEGPNATRAQNESMQAIGERQNASWGECSDPAIHNPNPTCCHGRWNSKAQYWYDRTALCGGGTVDQFQVNDKFVCGTSEEHKFTQALVHLPKKSDEMFTVI